MRKAPKAEVAFVDLQLSDAMNSFRAARRWREWTAGRLEDATLVLVLVFAAPLLILLLGTPIALCLRVTIEILGRL